VIKTRTILVFACCIAVAACAAEKTAEQKIVWTRNDGRPVVHALLEIDQADCHDEEQKAGKSFNIDKFELLPRQSKADDKFVGCMADRGYLAAK
jgi:hypothetical protein